MSIRYDHGCLVGLEEKAITETEDAWTISGYGSVFGNTDLGNDIVVAGAFGKSLREHGNPLLLFNHKMEDAPIGCVIDAKEDKRGLWFKAELPKDDSFVAGRIIPQLKRRGLKGMSIGYKIAPGGSERRKDGVRLLKELRLVELSVVNTPMNPLAAVETIKGLSAVQEFDIDRNARSFDAKAALARLRAKFGDDSDELKAAFLYADPDKGVEAWDARLLICDLDEKGCLIANHVALYKSAAFLYGSRSGDLLPEGVDEAVKAHLDLHYQRLNLESPSKSLAHVEFQALSPGEREARLRGLGISQRLAKTLSGPRDADRDETSQRDAAIANAARGFVTAILDTVKDLEAE